MLKVRIVTGFMGDTAAELTLEDRINSIIEDLEREHMRVRDISVHTIPHDYYNMPASAIFGFAVLRYDDSALYSPEPEEIGDAYHRKEKFYDPEFGSMIGMRICATAEAETAKV